MESRVSVGLRPSLLEAAAAGWIVVDDVTDAGFLGVALVLLSSSASSSESSPQPTSSSAEAATE